MEQLLLHWGNKWRRTTLIMHIDNKAVVHGLKNRTIRGGSMNVLRRCLLLATEYDLELEVQWVSTKENALADALSRLEYNPIADLAPQLVPPTCNRLDCGFQTYSKQDYHQQQATTCGED